MPAGEDRGKQLLDHIGLPDDDLLQLPLHQPSMLAELLKNVSEAAGLRGGQRGSLLIVRKDFKYVRLSSLINQRHAIARNDRPALIGFPAKSPKLWAQRTKKHY